LKTPNRPSAFGLLFIVLEPDDGMKVRRRFGLAITLPKVPGTHRPAEIVWLID
jgi:hypothetical protein